MPALSPEARAVASERSRRDRTTFSKITALPFTASMPAVVPVAKYLPAAMTVFCTAAPEAEQAERLHQSGPGEHERRRVAGTHYRFDRAHAPENSRIGVTSQRPEKPTLRINEATENGGRMVSSAPETQQWRCVMKVRDVMHKGVDCGA
jgi:hypothetical protein